jgi:hypothetical protein
MTLSNLPNNLPEPNRRLWQRADDLREKEELIIHLTEDGDDEQLEKLAEEWFESSVNFDNKAFQVASCISYLESLEEASEAKIKQIQATKKTIQNKIKRLTNYLLRNMARVNKERIIDGLQELKITKNPPKVELLVEEEELPDEVFNEKVVRTVNKTYIRDQLRTGRLTGYARMIQDLSVKFKNTNW